ncbi:MAG: hypothetical protein FJ098_14390 [Deltaproteobacteria bacterium]|nr:hypothetical protein [Deltaproteobacteria bacterium]
MRAEGKNPGATAARVAGLLLFTGLASAATGWFMFQEGQRSRREGDEAAMAAACTALCRETPDPLGEAPFLVFDRLRLTWRELVPGLELAAGAGADAAPALLGTFPVPGDPEGSAPEGLTADGEGLSFPHFGAHYLRTTLGDLKVLLLDPAQDPEERLLAVTGFVARNHVFNRMDERLIIPNVDYPSFRTPGRLLRKLFGSDQPVGLHCQTLTWFLNHVLRRLGYQTCWVQLLWHRPGARPLGHVVSQVRIPGGDRWVFLDATDCYVLRGPTGRLLSVQEAVPALEQGVLEVVPLAPCRRLRDEFNRDTRWMGSFAWTPDKHQELPMWTPEEYRERIRHLLDEYIIYEDGEERFVELERGGAAVPTSARPR